MLFSPNRDSQNGETDRGDKSFSCGHPVWGLAFGPRPPKSAAAAWQAKASSKGNGSLLLATGLENGVIKIWSVFTGERLLSAGGGVPVDVFRLIFKPLFVFYVQVTLYSTSMAMKAS